MPPIVAVTGSSGMIGSALTPKLIRSGYDVVRLVRRDVATPERQVRWNPDAGTIDAQALEGIEAVVHLAGESVASGRVTPKRTRRIVESRVQGTRLLANALAALRQPPRTLICASAIGYYGDRGDELLSETSASGEGFLADLCREWEMAARAAVDCGIRVVHLRIGIVLSTSGGALATMAPIFRLGLGGPLGSGRQVMSWVALDDVLGAIMHALTTDMLRGPVNVTAPHPVTNREFTKLLGRVLARPAFLPVPPLALRLLFGELAEEGAMASAKVVPTKLQQTGYRFLYPDVEPALRHVLGG